MEHPGVDGRIILNLIFDKWNWGGGGRNWTDLGDDRDKWLALVNAAMNNRVP